MCLDSQSSTGVTKSLVSSRCSRKRRGWFHLSFHPGQQCSGAAGILADPPVVNFLDGDHVQVVPAAAPFALHDHQPGFFQHSKVLHHGAAVNLPEMAAELPGGLGRLLEQVEDLAPAVVRQRFENQVLPGP
jgi:hypothetical protein